MKNLNKWFTLVELIIVVTILAVLATVWFISYEEYLVDTRDSKRLAQLTGLRDSLRLGITKWKLPLPDDAVEIRNNGVTFLHQWYAGKNVLESISFSENTIDPLDDSYYTYLVSQNRKDFQILGFLEKYNPSVISSILPEWNAQQYAQRYPQVMWKKLWILLQQQTNTPLQAMTEYATSGYIDLQDTTTNEFDAYVTDIYVISWKQEDLLGILPYTTCKRLLENGWVVGSGIYNINPSWFDPFEVYCDMEIDGWGWTLLWRSVPWFNIENFWWVYSTWNIRDDSVPYSLGIPAVDINFSEIMYATYESWKTVQYADKLTVDDNFFRANYNSQYLDPGATDYTNQQALDYTVSLLWCEFLYTDGSTCGTFQNRQGVMTEICTPCSNYGYPPAVWWKFWYKWFMFPWRVDYENGLRSNGMYVGWGHPYVGKQGMVFVR